MLFTDGSVDTNTRIGFGAYLVVDNTETAPADLKATVRVKRFEETSSTILELQTLLWAMDDAVLLRTEKRPRVTAYSDSQNIQGLLARRSSLEARKYFSRNGRQLNSADLYRQFFTMVDERDCHIIKLDGHKPGRSKNDIDRLFSLVDKASRLALRQFNRQSP
jgi:ribonuclease HI